MSMFLSGLKKLIFKLSSQPKLCKLRDLYLLAKLDGELSKEEHLWLLQVCQKENISNKLLAKVISNPWVIRDFYPTEEKEKLHYFHQLVTMMMIDGKCSKDEIVFCEQVGCILGYNKEMMTKIVVANGKANPTWEWAALSYIANMESVNIGGQDIANNLKTDEVQSLFDKAMQGVEYISNKYKKLSKEGEIEALIFCSTFLVELRSDYSNTLDKSLLSDRYFLELHDHILCNADVDDIVALVNNRVELYHHLKQDESQLYKMKVILFDYPCCLDALERASKNVGMQDYGMMLLCHDIIKDMDNYYGIKTSRPMSNNDDELPF